MHSLPLNMDTNPATTPSPEPAPQIPRAKINWLIFFAAMFVPTVITILSVQTGSKDTPPIVALLGSGVSGIICGAMLGRRFGRTPETKIALGVVFILVMGAACIAMNCFGCLAGGYKMDFR
jgi:drug/metabolite transporter (DMT)-like permease